MKIKNTFSKILKEDTKIVKKNEMRNKYENGFEFGWQQRRACDADSIKAKILQACGVTSETQWWALRLGKQELKGSQISAIEQIFAEYGITEVWGTAETEVSK